MPLPAVLAGLVILAAWLPGSGQAQNTVGGETAARPTRVSPAAIEVPETLEVQSNLSDSDGDGIPDTDDNCPDDANADQEDMDNDGQGNICDDDVDFDGLHNGIDDDDDNDGLLDILEAVAGSLTYDPDSDNDGVIDGLDRDPDSDANVLDTCVSPDATLNLEIPNTMTCAATDSVTSIEPAGVTATGDLQIISPTVVLGNGFSVDNGGRLKVISADPTATKFDPPCDGTDLRAVLTWSDAVNLDLKLGIPGGQVISPGQTSGAHSISADVTDAPGGETAEILCGKASEDSRYQLFIGNEDASTARNVTLEITTPAESLTLNCTNITRNFGIRIAFIDYSGGQEGVVEVVDGIGSCAS